MAESRWIDRFLGGVADAALARALLHDSAGHAVLTDLNDGRRRWRSSQPLWPLGLTADLACGLVFDGTSVAVVALDPGTGAERWRSTPLGWPAWAAASAAAAGLDGASDLYAAWRLAPGTAEVGGAGAPAAPAALLLAWALRPPSGGAQRAGAATTPVGACELLLADGRLTVLSAATAATLLDAAEAAQAAGEASDTEADGAGAAAAHPGRPRWIESDDPAVLAQVEWRGMRYALAQRPIEGDSAGAVQLTLEAATADSEFGFMRPAADSPLRRHWRCALDDAPVPRRQPLPPPPC